MPDDMDRYVEAQHRMPSDTDRKLPRRCDKCPAEPDSTVACSFGSCPEGARMPKSDSSTPTSKVMPCCGARPPHHLGFCTPRIRLLTDEVAALRVSKADALHDAAEVIKERTETIAALRAERDTEQLAKRGAQERARMAQAEVERMRPVVEAYGAYYDTPNKMTALTLAEAYEAYRGWEAADAADTHPRP